MINSSLQVVLDEDLELSIFRHWIGRVKVFVLPFLIRSIPKVKLYSIVSCRDGLDIPIDITECLLVIDVIHVKDAEQKYK